MTFWRITEKSNMYRSFDFVDIALGFGFADQFSPGKSLSSTWIPPLLCLFEGDEQFEGDVEREQAKPIGDFPGFAGTIPLIFSKRAIQILYPLINDSIEILPIDCDVEDYSIVNVLKVVDCLDHSRSKIKRMEGTGYIVSIDEYVFKEEMLEDVHIFQIPEDISAVFVSDVFKAVAEQHGLEGLAFIPLDRWM